MAAARSAGATEVSALCVLDGAYLGSALAAGRTDVSCAALGPLQPVIDPVAGQTAVYVRAIAGLQVGVITASGATRVLVRSTLVTAGAGGDPIDAAPMSDNEPIAIGMGLTGTFTAGFAEGT